MCYCPAATDTTEHKIIHSVNSATELLSVFRRSSFSTYEDGLTGEAAEHPELDTSRKSGMAEADYDGVPLARQAAAAVPLDLLQGLAVFGGESKEGLQRDTWILSCTAKSNLWIWGVVGKPRLLAAPRRADRAPRALIGLELLLFRAVCRPIEAMSPIDTSCLWCILGAVVAVLILVYFGIKWYLKKRKERAQLLRVTELLKNIGKSGSFSAL